MTTRNGKGDNAIVYTATVGPVIAAAPGGSTGQTRACRAHRNSRVAEQRGVSSLVEVFGAI